MIIKDFYKNFLSINLLALLIVFNIASCKVSEEKNKVSAGLDTMKNIFVLDIQINLAKWEIFGTPEYLGGILGPTDYLTFVAEVSPVHANFFDRDNRGRVWIAPEASRNWLRPNFAKLIERHKNSTFDISQEAKCRSFSSVLRQTSKPVSGMICADEDVMLIYLTLASPN